MSVQTSIVSQANASSGLNALIAGRIYADVAPANVKTPYIVFKRVSTRVHLAMQTIVRRQYRYQFDSYAPLKADSIALDEQVISAFSFLSDESTGGSIHTCLYDSDMDEILAISQNAQIRATISSFIIFS